MDPDGLRTFCQKHSNPQALAASPTAELDAARGEIVAVGR